jgi:hypothetical protein
MKYSRILACFFASVFCSRIAFAAGIAVPEIPNRFQLPRVAPDAYEGTIPRTTDLADLKTFLLTPGASRQKLDAVEVVRQHAIKASVPGEARASTFRDFLTILESMVRNRQDNVFRRFTIASIFGPVYGAIRDYVLSHPDDREAWAAYGRISKIRLHCMQDRDQKLRNFFDRYVSLNSTPKWKRTKKKIQSFYPRLLKDHPNKRELFQTIWEECQQIESAQLASATENIHAVDGNRTLKRSRRKKIVRILQSTFSYHMNAIWGAIPETINEELGAGTVQRYGTHPTPVILGWTNLGPIAKR